MSESLQQILTKARKVDDLVAEIAGASKEQAQGIGQIQNAAVQMDTLTQGNAASAEETASAAEELSAQAHSMQDVVGELFELITGTKQSVKVAVRKPKSNRTPTIKKGGPAEMNWKDHDLSAVGAGLS